MDTRGAERAEPVDFVLAAVEFGEVRSKMTSVKLELPLRHWTKRRQVVQPVGKRLAKPSRLQGLLQKAAQKFWKNTAAT